MFYCRLLKLVLFMHTIPDLTNEAVFESLFRTHYAPLATFALRYVSDRELAEEIVQEMFTNLWSGARDIQIKTSVKSYLFGSVRNACLNYLKHQKVKEAYAQSQWNRMEFDATDYIELDELETQIAGALEKLPGRCREIFELSRLEGMRYKEIANHLKLSLKTVENQMGKALAILRDELGDYLPLLWLHLLVWG